LINLDSSHIINAKFKTGQHFREVLNRVFSVLELRAAVHRGASTDEEKAIKAAALAELTTIASFKDKISSQRPLHLTKWQPESMRFKVLVLTMNKPITFLHHG
jgi:hypothetical protein